MAVTTKGEMIKILKRFGIRYGEKGNSVVKLEHLKYVDVCKLFDKFEKEFVPTEYNGPKSTGDSEHFLMLNVMEGLRRDFNG